METTIRIDKTLPNYGDLVAFLRTKNYNIADINEGNCQECIDIRYSHDPKTLSKLSPLGAFNSSCKAGNKTKTLFLSWYSTRWHHLKFSPFANAEREQNFLWVAGLCDCIQLPAMMEDIEQKLKKLLT